jgi:hypothetical protein
MRKASMATRRSSNVAMVKTVHVAPTKLIRKLVAASRSAWVANVGDELEGGAAASAGAAAAAGTSTAVGAFVNKEIILNFASPKF